MWASDLAYEILGIRTRVQSQDAPLAAEIARLWSPFKRPGTAARLRHTFSIVQRERLMLYRDCSLHSTAHRGDVVLRLLMEANRQLLADYDGFAAHSAVLGSDVRVGAVLAESGAGKSTLAASGIMAGLRYGSDEALCIGDDDSVVPYPKPLGLSRRSVELLGIGVPDLYTDCDEVPTPAVDLGGSLLEPGRRLSDLIVPDRTESSPPRFHRLSAADGVALLLSNSFNHYRDPQGSYLLTARLAASCRVWRFTYSDPIEAGKAVADHLSA